MHAARVESGAGDEEEEDDGFEGTPRPMLPYSSMYIFGPTNPYVLSLTLQSACFRVIVAPDVLERHFVCLFVCHTLLLSQN